MQTILVTGGAGFIGGCLVRRLIAHEDARVVNLDKLTYAGSLESLETVSESPRHVFVRGDVCDRGLLASLLREHAPRAVFHLAAESHVDRSIDSPAAFVETNVVGAFQLLEATLAYWRQLDGAAKERFRFVHVSTDEVYGSLEDDSAADETAPYAPNSPYSASKAASDHFVRAYHRTFGLPVLITNSVNNYGPRQHPEKLIPTMILNAAEGKPLPVYGDGQHVRDWLYVEDEARALHRVLEAGRPGQVYHIGGGCRRSNLDVVRTICSLVDRLRPDLPHAPCESLITHVADRPGHDRRYALSARKIEEELGWRPQEDFESGLEQTVAWYLENKQWVETVTSADPQRRRLGLRSDGNQDKKSGDMSG